MSFKEVVITADSTCDLPIEYIKNNNIKILPLSILLGEKEYKDGVDVFPNDIYSFVDSTSVMPKTSAVVPSEYYSLFKELNLNNKSVVHISLSSSISSSYQNACLSAKKFEDVYVVDSKNLCTAMGLLVLKAVDFKNEGLDAKTISKKVSDLVSKVSSTFVLNSLDYLSKGGRCSSLSALGANVLSIKPSIIVNKNGELELSKKYRGNINSVYKKYINDCLENISSIDTSRIAIANSGEISKKHLDEILKLINKNYNFDDVILSQAGCTISSHCGPKTLALFYIRK